MAQANDPSDCLVTSYPQFVGGASSATEIYAMDTDSYGGYYHIFIGGKTYGSDHGGTAAVTPFIQAIRNKPYSYAAGSKSWMRLYQSGNTETLTQVTAIRIGSGSYNTFVYAVVEGSSDNNYIIKISRATGVIEDVSGTYAGNTGVHQVTLSNRLSKQLFFFWENNSIDWVIAGGYTSSELKILMRNYDTGTTLDSINSNHKIEYKSKSTQPVSYHDVHAMVIDETNNKLYASVTLYTTQWDTGFMSTNLVSESSQDPLTMSSTAVTKFTRLSYSVVTEWINVQPQVLTWASGDRVVGLGA